jgi:endo-1,4-beta-xylanase
VIAPTRRTVLAGAAATALLPFASHAAPAPGPSLDALARLSGRRFGSAMGSGQNGPRTRSFQDTPYRAIMAAECGVMTPENELKWSVIRKGGADSFDWAPADRLLDFAEANAMAFRGHTLLWHHPDYTPKWLATHDYGAQPASAAAKLITDHVTAVCRRFGSRILSYDGVNEAIDPETGEMRTTPLTASLAPLEAVDLVFHTARAAAPHAELVYNDYMSWEPGRPLHLPAVLRLLEGFRKRGVPVDALGIQGHIGDPGGAKDQPFGARDERSWRRFLDDVVSMGYRLHLTELDVSDKKLPAPIAERDRAVAAYARDWLDCLLDYPQLGDVIVWGITDQYSWLNGLTPRADKLLKRPTPYDDRFQPKPLRQAIADAFIAAGKRA